jgi:hypothetical protein
MEKKWKRALSKEELAGLLCGEADFEEEHGDVEGVGDWS